MTSTVLDTDGPEPAGSGGSLDGALAAGLAGTDPGPLAALSDRPPEDRRDAALALARIHDLHLAPLSAVGGAARWQHHPTIASLKLRLEGGLLDRLARLDAGTDWSTLPGEPVAAVRAIGNRDQVPQLYRWVAERADREGLLGYLGLEGGPDGGFDDLVALCQIGLDGEAKLELGNNYWDEMGRGEGPQVHTELYRRFVRAVDLPVLERRDQPIEALERSLLGSLLATNRVLQPEMVGALGVIELQAGPRCRRVVAGLDRLGFGTDARDFYDEHAVTDPRHGKDWLDKVIATLAGDPVWDEGIIRGARWRWLVNDRFFTAMVERFIGDDGDPAPVG